jgi:hypothetical protein
MALSLSAKEDRQGKALNEFAKKYHSFLGLSKHSIYTPGNGCQFMMNEFPSN